MSTTLLILQAVAEQLGVTKRTVRTWIDDGELRAVDCSIKPGSKPRYRVRPEDLERFLERRATMPAVKATRRRQMAEVPDYFGRSN